MALDQLADIIQPEYFAEYMANNSMVSTALFQSGVLVPNALMQASSVKINGCYGGPFHGC